MKFNIESRYTKELFCVKLLQQTDTVVITMLDTQCRQLYTYTHYSLKKNMKILIPHEYLLAKM